MCSKLEMNDVTHVNVSRYTRTRHHDVMLRMNVGRED